MDDETKQGIDHQGSDPKQADKSSSKDPGHFGNQGRPPRQLLKPDLEERYQRDKEQAPQDDPGGEPRSTDGDTAIPARSACARCCGKAVSRPGRQSRASLPSRIALRAASMSRCRPIATKAWQARVKT
jgi:hypothetical protein